MQISQTSVSLLIVAWLFAVVTFYFFQTAGQIRVDEEIRQEIQRKEKARLYFEKTGEKMPTFSFSGYSNYEYNYADYLTLGFLILTSSTIVAAIWFRKRE